LSESIGTLFTKLKLATLARDWESIEFTDKTQYLRDLLEYELSSREANRITRMVKTANFQVVKTLDDFDWHKQIQLPDSITKAEILRGKYIKNKENLIFLGSVGTGKTHLATALSVDACNNGTKTKFFTAASLANTLVERNQKGTLGSFMENLRKTQLIVIDEIGFIPLHKEAAELLFQVISECYERKSLIITSNLEFSGWNAVFGDNRLTAALIDRLVHHSHILIFSGESRRLQSAMRTSKMKVS